MDNPSTLERSPEPRFPTQGVAPPGGPVEDSGRSLAAMAYHDLDAALQLLAERAQYITGASGAIIALRRGDHNDMLCRASAGPNAPELGALLSMEYGFSGESVRTRQALRCDDAERDPRVNREGCRRLGISSVVAMPILSEHQVLGVFELFSGKANAFAERDLAALQRLGEMVETAVKYAVAAQTVSEIQEEAAADEILSPMDEVKVQVEAEPETILATDDVPPTPVIEIPRSSEEIAPMQTAQESALQKTELQKTDSQKSESQPETKTAQPEKPVPENSEPLLTAVSSPEPAKAELKPALDAAPKKPLFWTASSHAAETAPPAPKPSPSAPPILRNLQNCQACGFPVSQGRTYCVECEEKQWRGQPVSKPAPTISKEKLKAERPQPTRSIANSSAVSAALPTAPPPSRPTTAPLVNKSPDQATPKPEPAKSALPKPESAKPELFKPELPTPQNAPTAPSTLFLSSTVQSQSWLAANKYILAVLILVALILAALALR